MLIVNRWLKPNGNEVMANVPAGLINSDKAMVYW